MKIKLVGIILCLCCALIMNACRTAEKPTGMYRADVSTSYYHSKFNGRKTASGAMFGNNKLTTIHPSLPFGTQLKVTNRANGKPVIVTVTDRGPFTKGRELDLTKRAFMGITDNKNKDVLQVDIEIVKQQQIITSITKILYLHGFDSTLQDDRRAVLAPCGEIVAPVLDYRNIPDLFSTLVRDYADITAIIGSSAGGLVAYYLTQALLKPCLLFSPAFTHKNELPAMAQSNLYYAAYTQIVIGLQDTVISPWQSLAELKGQLKTRQSAKIHPINTVAHSYPIGIFEKEVAYLMQKIGD